MATRIQLQWTEYNNNIASVLRDTKNLKPTVLDATMTLNDVDTISVETSNGYNVVTAHALLTEDYSLDFRSNFTSALDRFGGNSIGSLLQYINQFQSTLTGTTSKLTAFFDYQLWEKTEPIKLNLEVMFMLDTDAYLDVYLPTMSLCSLSALTEYEGSYLVPGIHFSNLKLVNEQQSNTQGGGANSGKLPNSKSDNPLVNLAANGPQIKSKFLSITMPGFQNDLMLVNDAKPTFSKHPDETGYPIWSKVQLDLQSLLPASSDQLFKAGFV